MTTVWGRESQDSSSILQVRRSTASSRFDIFRGKPNKRPVVGKLKMRRPQSEADRSTEGMVRGHENIRGDRPSGAGQV